MEKGKIQGIGAGVTFSAGLWQKTPGVRPAAVKVSYEQLEPYLVYTNSAGTNRRSLALARRALARALPQLTSRQREMVWMYYYEQKKMPAIARELGVNKSTVSRTVSRGLHNLKKRMRGCRLR